MKTALTALLLAAALSAPVAPLSAYDAEQTLVLNGETATARLATDGRILIRDRDGVLFAGLARAHGDGHRLVGSAFARKAGCTATAPFAATGHIDAAGAVLRGAAPYFDSHSCTVYDASYSREVVLRTGNTATVDAAPVQPRG